MKSDDLLRTISPAHWTEYAHLTVLMYRLIVHAENSPECHYGADKQTVNHIAFEYPMRSYPTPRTDRLTTPITFYSMYGKTSSPNWTPIVFIY